MKLNKAFKIVAAATIASPVARAFSTKTASSSTAQHVASASALPKVNTFFGSRFSSVPRRGGGIGVREVSTTSLSLFDKLFGGGGYSAKIDYTAIPYPVPQLAEMALEGDAGVELVKNGKTLKLATFAGGCFWGLELYYQRIPGVEYTGVVSADVHETARKE